MRKYYTRKKLRTKNKSRKYKKRSVYGGTKNGLNPTAAEFVFKSELNPKANEFELKVNNIPFSHDQIENAVAIDCEMVGVGRAGTQSVLAHVAIVDFNGNILYDKYVLPEGGIEAITNYRTKYSGIIPSTLAGLDKRTHSFDIVKKEVRDILKNRVIVGHGLTNDFNALGFNIHNYLIWDTTQLDKYKQNHPRVPGIRQPRKLKALAFDFANNNIQRPDKDGHSPLEDARASMNLFRLDAGYPKISYINMSK